MLISMKRGILMGTLAALLIAAGAVYYYVGKNVSAPTPPPAEPSALKITTAAGNYGLFIDNDDNAYFSTHDPIVRNIIETYLAEKEYPYDTDAEMYGNALVYYYTKDRFIAAWRHDWADRNSLSSFAMHDVKTGEWISDCTIFRDAGLYRDSDLLLSVTHIDDGNTVRKGACLYERGASNFVFIDLTSKLLPTEDLFNDPTGGRLKAAIREVDTNARTFVVDVFDTEREDAEGGYARKRSIEVSY